MRTVPSGSPWLAVAAVLVAGRLLAVACHYLVRSPWGTRYEGSLATPVLALALELGSLLIVLSLFRLLAHALSGVRRGAAAVLALYALVSSAYLFLGQMDLELMRWLGQHISWSWLATYSWKPGPLKTRLFRSDTAPTLLAFLLATMPPLAACLLALRGRRRAGGLSWLATGLIALGAVLGTALATAEWRSGERWTRMRPPLFTFAAEVTRAFGDAPGQEEVTAGLDFLHAALKRPPEYFPVPGYPLWHEVADEEARLARFRAQPLDRKPDVLVLFVESPEGWEFDLRRPEVQSRFPNLARLWRERGVLFPYCHSVGYPSTSGRVGFHLGLWSHPFEPILTRFRGIRLTSLPEVLERAGYDTLLVTAGDPEFDRMQFWYDRWYRHWEFDPARADDVSAARRFLEVVAERRGSHPTFMNLATVSMHMPMTYPGCACPEDQPFHERYLEAARYTDRALGIVLDALRADRRWQHTAVVIVGDHAMPPPSMQFQAWKAGTPNVAETWTFLMIAAPRFAGGGVRTEPVSQVDVAPTVLALAGVQVSHHFAGRDLFDPVEPVPEAVYAFRRRGVGITRGDVRLQGKLDDPRFLLKTRYTDLDPACRDPEPFGCYHGGTPLSVTAEDRERMAQTGTLASAYAELFRRDALMPPQATQRQLRRPTP